MEPENTNNDFLALPENLKLNGYNPNWAWIQNSSSPKAIFLKEQIEKTGRKIGGYSSLPSGPSNVGESKETNGWLLEYVNKR